MQDTEQSTALKSYLARLPIFPAWLDDGSEWVWGCKCDPESGLRAGHRADRYKELDHCELCGVDARRPSPIPARIPRKLDASEIAELGALRMLLHRVEKCWRCGLLSEGTAHGMQCCGICAPHEIAAWNASPSLRPERKIDALERSPQWAAAARFNHLVRTAGGLDPPVLPGDVVAPTQEKKT